MTGARPILLTAFLLLLAAPFALFGFLSVRILEPRLLSEFDTQTVNAVGGVQRRIDRAVSVFGDLDALRDVEQVLDHARSSARGMSFLAVTDPDGAILHLSADDPAAARGALDAVAVPDAPAPGGGFEGRVRDMTGLAPVAPVTVASRRGNDLLVTSLSLGGDDRPIGALHAGVDIGTLDALKRDIWIDTGVVVLAIVLLAVELLILGFAVYLLRPAWAIDFLTARLRDRDLRFTLRGFGVGAARRIVERVDGIIASAAASFRPSDGLRLPGPDGARVPHIPAVSHVRLPLFLFFLSEALLRPILPRFLGDFAPSGLDPEFGIGILMAGFMAASLFSVLIGSILSEGRGSPRRVFVWGTVCAGCGMSGHLVAGDFTSILLLRMLTGLGYGLVYAAAQVYIAQHADPVRRTAGFSLFLAVIVAAEICGPAIGGILADRFGDAPVVATATLAIALAAIACALLLPRFPPDITDPGAVPRVDAPAVEGARGVSMGGMLRGQWNTIPAVLANTRFSVAIFCFAIPAKALLTGGLFLLVPLTVFANGGAAAESARVLMGYGIAILLLVPILAPLADRLRGFGIWVAAGGMAAGAGFVVPHAWGVFGGGGLMVLFVSTVLFGFGQTLSIPAQISFLMQAAHRQVDRFGAGTVLGLFRFLERLGSFAGPLIAGMLLLRYPPDAALMWMGLGAVVLAAIGLSWFLAVGQQDEEDAINALLVET